MSAPAGSVPDTVGSSPDEGIQAAGTLPWRVTDGRLEVALVHRPRYDDWSWPKGKLEEGEAWASAAVRETFEETGLRVRLGLPLPTASYEVKGSPKVVRYWAAEVVGGAGRLVHEVDDVAWCDSDGARARLTHERDTAQLDALVAAHADGRIGAIPFAVVRHAKARPRKKWKKPDWRRPLDARGKGEAVDLVDLLGAYALDRVVSSTSVRCVDTVKPYAKSAGAKFATTKRLSEEGYAARPAKAVATLEDELGRARRTAVCSHGPVLPDLLRALAVHADAGGGDVVAACRAALLAAADENLDKGEAMIVHVHPEGVRVVALERHRPDDAA